MPCANLMRILYKKGFLNEAGPVSRHPDFSLVDKLRMPIESLWWDEHVPDIDTNDNNPALLALLTLEILNVGDDFLSKLKGAYSSTCSYLVRILKGDRDRKLRNHRTDCFDITIV
jgi:hypothetical protein